MEASGILKTVIALALIGLVIIIYYIGKWIIKRNKLNAERRILNDYLNQLEINFLIKPETDILMKKHQGTTIVKPKLKEYAKLYSDACTKETKLRHQIKVDPNSIRHDVAVDYLNKATQELVFEKMRFHSALDVAIYFKYVPEDTTFKKCLNFK